MTDQATILKQFRDRISPLVDAKIAALTEHSPERKLDGVIESLERMQADIEDLSRQMAPLAAECIADSGDTVPVEDVQAIMLAEIGRFTEAFQER